MEDLFVDEYGFEYHWSKDFIVEYSKYQSNIEESQTKAWTTYINQVGGIENIDFSSTQAKNLVRRGIPTCLRPMVWGIMLDVQKKMNENAYFYKESLAKKDTIPTNYKDTIEKDIPRTFQNNQTLNKQLLSNILYAFAASHPKIYYCQSLNFLAAIFLKVLGEEPAFYALSQVVEKYLPDDYFCNGMHGFRVDLKLFETLLSERTPEVFKHAKQLHHEWMITASGWLLTLFTNTFPISTVLRIWDSFLLEGQKIVYRTAIGFIRINQDAFLATKKLSEFTNILAEKERTMIDQDSLMKESFSIRAFSRSHLAEKRQAALNFVDKGIEDSSSSIHEILGHLHM